MFTFRQKSVLNAILGLALLFAGGANSFTVSVDADGDEDTPPIVVELSLDNHKKTPVELKADPQHRQAECTCTESSQHMMKSLDRQPVPGPGKGSPELLVPLRT
jgi:hypothetical protein